MPGKTLPSLVKVSNKKLVVGNVVGVLGLEFNI